jgi:hypothetical protein
LAIEFFCGSAKLNAERRVQHALAGVNSQQAVAELWQTGNSIGICALARIFLFG